MKMAFDNVSRGKVLCRLFLAVRLPRKRKRQVSVVIAVYVALKQRRVIVFRSVSAHVKGGIRDFIKRIRNFCRLFPDVHGIFVFNGKQLAHGIVIHSVDDFALFHDNFEAHFDGRFNIVFVACIVRILFVGSKRCLEADGIVVIAHYRNRDVRGCLSDIKCFCLADKFGE